MATSNSTVPLGPHDYHTPIESLVNIYTTESTNEITNQGICSNILRCFICDIEVQGRRYALASCRTQSSKSRVIEKLGELVGERYMVVISEDDIICRSCANLMNSLDRLETEMKNVRGSVLRFLEHKYSLKEGELCDNNENKTVSQPPQITQWKSKNVILDGGKNKKPGPWLQCNKCKYTTQYNTFMIHHMRDHIKQKVCCDKCGIKFPVMQQESEHQCSTPLINLKNMKQENQELLIKHVASKPMDNSTIKPSKDVLLSAAPMQSQVLDVNSASFLPISPSNNFQIQNILVPESNAGQPIYFKIVSNSHTNESIILSLETPKVDATVDGISEDQKNAKKQVLTVAEDGTLRVVEVPLKSENPATPF